MSLPNNQPNCITWEKVIRLEEKFNNAEKEKLVMWKKIDNLALTIGCGKNWIIGIMVTLSLNLIGVITTLTIVISRTPH